MINKIGSKLLNENAAVAEKIINKLTGELQKKSGGSKGGAFKPHTDFPCSNSALYKHWKTMR